VNLYAVLGVERGASADEVRRAYRQAVLLWHPDRNPDPDAAAVFHAVQQAYEQLRDPARRASYDVALEGTNGIRKLRFDDGEQPDWVPPEHEREPLRFVVGEGWTSLDGGPAGSRRPAAQPRAASPTQRRWTRDERLGLGVAVFAAVAGAVAIAIAPMFS
jgi:curved DNA-binding protein CbpA